MTILTTGNECRDLIGKNGCSYGIEERLNAIALATVGKGIFENDIGHRDMPASWRKWSNDGPWSSVDDDLGPDHTLGKGLGDAVALILGRKSWFAKAIAQETTEERFAAAVTHRFASGTCPFGSVGRPDDVEARPKRNVADGLEIGITPDDQPPNPKTRFLAPLRRGDAKTALPNEIRLPRHRATS
jgi:hypothetical protein